MVGTPVMMGRQRASSPGMSSARKRPASATRCPGQQRREDGCSALRDAAASHAAAGRPASGRYAPARRAHCSSAAMAQQHALGWPVPLEVNSSSAGASGASAGAQAGSPSARRSAAAGGPPAARTAVRVRGAVWHPGQSHRGERGARFLIGQARVPADTGSARRHRAQDRDQLLQNALHRHGDKSPAHARRRSAPAARATRSCSAA